MSRTWTPIKEYTDIRFEFFAGIAKITINRPEVYNAFRPETTMEMLEAMDICREMNEVGVVVLTGEGDKAFCSGGDQNVKGRGGYIGADGVPRLNILEVQRLIRFMPKVDDYYTFYSWFLLALGIVFQVPVVIFVLARIGLVTAGFLLRQVKWAVLLSFIVAAVVTPTPDMVTQTLLALPMIGLYLLGVVVAALFGKKRKPANALTTGD